MTCPLSVDEARKKGILIREYECISPVVEMNGIPLEIDWAMLHYPFSYKDSYSDKVNVLRIGEYILVAHFKNGKDLNKLGYSHSWQVSNNWDGLLQYNCARFLIHDIPSDTIPVYVERMFDNPGIPESLHVDTIGCFVLIAH